MNSCQQKDRPLVVCAISGGIAAYKAAEVVSALHNHGLEVRVVMSDSAQKFITPLTFQALIGQRVATTMFPGPAANDPEEIYPHIVPAANADAFVLLPASAGMIARIANGFADDLVAATALALSDGCRRIFCPAMHTNMWNQESTRANVATLEKWGWLKVGPGRGRLACGAEGEGRMSEPAEIVAAVLSSLGENQSLAGKRVLILSGPTRERLDPVRYISNASSGKMGRALALAAASCGAEVDFVTGPVDRLNLPSGPRVTIHEVESTRQMSEVAKKLFDKADITIFAAAVADYCPVAQSASKRTKTAANWKIELEPTIDIAAMLGKKKRSDQITIGFALQDKEAEKKARAKLRDKNLDGIILNTAEAIGADSADYRYLSAKDRNGKFARWGNLDKASCARRILREIVH